MRPVGTGPGGARRAAWTDGAGARLDAELSRAELNGHDDVEVRGPAGAGADAVASGGAGGRARAAAVALFQALARVPDDIAPLEANFGAFTDALAAARAQTAGDLGDLLDKYIAMRRRIAQQIGSISSG